MRYHWRIVILISAIFWGFIMMGCSQVNFRVEMIAVSRTGTSSIKYHIYTGEAWKTGPKKWIKIQDIETLPRSTYIIKMVSGGRGWAAVRLDTKTGRSWFIDANDVWEEVTE